MLNTKTARVSQTRAVVGFSVGKDAERIAAGALEKGMPPSSVITSDSCEEASAKLIGMLSDGDGVLVKGSRSAHMERVVEALVLHQNPGGYR